MSKRSGLVIGRYTLAEQVSVSGMVEVYKAADERLENQVLVTLFPVSAGASLAKRFEAEAKRLKKLDHANIAHLLDHGVHEDIAYIVTSFFSNGTLKEILGQPFPYQQAAGLIAPLARGLEYLHGKGFIHGDIKPSNIYINDDDQPVLAGIGLASIIEGEKDEIAASIRSGLRCAAYMAPEQWKEKPTARSDIYALGVIFYELLTGRCPYSGKSSDDVLHKKTGEPLVRPKKYASNLPDSVENLIFKALAKDAENRYSDMSEFAAALESLTLADRSNKQFASIDAETRVSSKVLSDEVDDIATTPLSASEEDIRTVAADTIPPYSDATQVDGATTPALPVSIKYTPSYAGAPVPPPPPPMQPAQAHVQPSYRVAAPAKRKTNVVLLAAAAVLVFVCLLASLAGGYFFLTADKGATEDEYIDSMIATGVSLTETALATPQSLEIGKKPLARSVLGFENTTVETPSPEVFSINKPPDK